MNKNNTKPVPLAPYAFRYSLFLTGALIVFLLLMRLVNLDYLVEVSFINDVIRAVFIVLAIANYKKLTNGAMSYMQGISVGVLVSVFSSVMFGFFMLIYSSFIYPEFLTNVNFEKYFGYDISPMMLFWHITIWGIGMGAAIITFVAMQFFKKPHHSATA